MGKKVEEMKTHEFAADNNVARKTPEEIKKGLEACQYPNGCKECPYEPDAHCVDVVMTDALAYIQQLESSLAQVERERDAAVSDCSRVPCSTCSKNVP